MFRDFIEMTQNSSRKYLNPWSNSPFVLADPLNSEGIATNKTRRHPIVVALNVEQGSLIVAERGA